MASAKVNGLTGVNGVNGTSQANGIRHEPNGIKGKSESRNPNSYVAKFNLPDHFIGGNHLDAAPSGRVKDFVLENDGHTVITNVSLRGLWTR